MDPAEMKQRTRQFSLRVIRLVESLPGTTTGSVIGRQLLRSATSVGANYRSALRAKSKADFMMKLKIVVEEADESLYWMELLSEAEIIPASRLTDLMNECDQLIAIVVTTIKNTRRNQQPETKVNHGQS
ncbi:MAG TPA: four helix bundle protein [Anaerolineaceae bacterium]|nr:four helix bundle protein [Anaerolineaceae bacterium]HNS38533.1 four helix bundle protein [Anaerolineaceae bacterium]